MKGTFSDRFKRVLQLARAAAVSKGNDVLGTEHLLLGIIRENTGLAVNVLRRLGVDLESMVEDIEESISQSGGVAVKGTEQMIPFSPRSKAVMQASADEACKRKCQIIETDHLLLALLKVTDTPAAATLSKYNVTFENAENVVNTLRQEEMSDSSMMPQRSQMRQTIRSKNSKTPILEHFGRDLTAMARQGKLDPIIGRAEEI